MLDNLYDIIIKHIAMIFGSYIARARSGETLKMILFSVRYSKNYLKI